ncbi:flavin-dependent monooxygenase, partial [Sphingobium sp. AS12]|uniref:acyl-CoA dehydrogenase family protein n=1 Tax=Sphingobium sp. AS12 TaxID=2849495 RepID=UPI001C31D751
GGDERPFADILRLVERIAQADGSAGWVASFAPQTALYLATLPLRALDEIYSDGPDTVVAGGLFPMQTAQVLPGGYLVDGQWSFASGCLGASWLGVGMSVEGQQGEGTTPLIAMLPASAVEIVPNWDVVGLKATASHDLKVVRQFVATEFTGRRGGTPLVEGALYRFPALCGAAFFHAVVALGIARAALDDLRSIAIGKISISGAPRPADRGFVQLAVGKAEAELRSARAFFYEQVEVVWAAVKRGDVPTIDEKALARIAASHAAEVGCAITRTAFRLAGTTATRMSCSLQRRMRDAAMITQHAFTNEGNVESGGRVLLGIEPPAGFP